MDSKPWRPDRKPTVEYFVCQDLTLDSEQVMEEPLEQLPGLNVWI